MNIKSIISEDLRIPENLIDDAVLLARTQVKIFRINKRNGGKREIFHPSKKLKTLQYWLIYKVFNHMPVHTSAMAYRKGISILHNATQHKSNRFFLKMDFENFFPSINFQDFIPLVRIWHQLTKPHWYLDNNTEDFIRKVCFYRNDNLAIGYPSSPVISNIVMAEFDSKISTLIMDKKYGEVTYTRYADDLIFSTNQKGACVELKKDIASIVGALNSPRLLLNQAKTKLSSSASGSASVTGIKVCENGHLTIHRKQKDHIRLLLSLYKKGNLKTAEELSLLGHIGYCHHIAPEFYTQLLKKYFKEVNFLKIKHS